MQILTSIDEIRAIIAVPAKEDRCSVGCIVDMRLKVCSSCITVDTWKWRALILGVNG
jgi:hypothetical protein